MNILYDKKKKTNNHRWDSGISRQKKKNPPNIEVSNADYFEIVFPTALKQGSSQAITVTEQELDVSFTKAPLQKSIFILLVVRSKSLFFKDLRSPLY